MTLCPDPEPMLPLKLDVGRLVEAKKPRRKSQCGRDLKAGPGSCWHWWEGCPEKVTPCAARLARDVRPAPADVSAWARENAATHFLAFAIVHAERYRTIAAAHAAWATGVRS